MLNFGNWTCLELTNGGKCIDNSGLSNVGASVIMKLVVSKVKLVQVLISTPMGLRGVFMPVLASFQKAFSMQQSVFAAKTFTCLL